jgi:hypothetical protein
VAVQALDRGEQPQHCSRDLTTATNGRTARKSQAVIERMTARAEPKSLGVENIRDGGLYSVRMTDPYASRLMIETLTRRVKACQSSPQF